MTNNQKKKCTFESDKQMIQILQVTGKDLKGGLKKKSEGIENSIREVGHIENNQTGWAW